MSTHADRNFWIPTAIIIQLCQWQQWISFSKVYYFQTLWADPLLSVVSNIIDRIEQRNPEPAPVGRSIQRYQERPNLLSEQTQKTLWAAAWWFSVFPGRTRRRPHLLSGEGARDRLCCFRPLPLHELQKQEAMHHIYCKAGRKVASAHQNLAKDVWGHSLGMKRKEWALAFRFPAWEKFLL